MGMAASQARYIELTARKTNVEYEGQQINQQRTALSNESAGMFSQLMSLNVPTPPSTQQFTTTEYKFNDGENTNTITSIKPLSGNADYNTTVSYYYTIPVYTSIGKTRTDLGVNNVGTAPNNTYWLTNGASSGATNQTQLIKCSTTDTDYQTDVKALTAITATGGAGAGKSIANTTSGFDPANPTTTIGNVWKYTAASGVTNYYSATDLANMVTNHPNGAAGSLQAYYASDIDTKQNVTENAYTTQSSSGRYSTIQLASETAPIDLTATTNTDQVAYNNAMNEYEYQQQVYAKQVENINAKTEVIEEEDRTLEMKLKQLDTEQEALQTEMDAVKKVIDKNIEQTFKTFS